MSDSGSSVRVWIDRLVQPLWLLVKSAARGGLDNPPPRSPGRLASILLTELEQPIFVIGAPRSGTSFLGSCLSALPFVSYHHEPRATKYASSFVWSGQWPRTVAKLYYLLSYKLVLWGEGGEGQRFAEKTPRNCFIIPFLHDLFPEAQFVHIIRDGRDAASSMSKKPWLQGRSKESGEYEPGGYKYGPYPRYWVEPDRHEEFRRTSDIHRCIWSWRRHVQHALHHGRALPPDRYMEVRYENLCAQPIDEGHRLVEFLNSAPDSLPDSFDEALREASVESIGRHEKELTQRQIEEVYGEAEPLLEYLGYV